MVSKRYILRHTVTSDEAIEFNGLRFCRSTNVYGYFPLLGLGNTVLPNQKSRVGIFFGEAKSYSELEEDYHVFIFRNAYSVG